MFWAELEASKGIERKWNLPIGIGKPPRPFIKINIIIKKNRKTNNPNKAVR